MANRLSIRSVGPDAVGAPLPSSWLKGEGPAPFGPRSILPSVRFGVMS